MSEFENLKMPHAKSIQRKIHFQISTFSNYIFIFKLAHFQIFKLIYRPRLLTFQQVVEVALAFGGQHFFYL